MTMYADDLSDLAFYFLAFVLIAGLARALWRDAMAARDARRAHEETVQRLAQTAPDRGLRIYSHAPGAPLPPATEEDHP